MEEGDFGRLGAEEGQDVLNFEPISLVSRKIIAKKNIQTYREA